MTVPPTAPDQPDQGEVPAGHLARCLDELEELIASAKPRALGAGAIIDRDRAVALLRAARDHLPAQLRFADEIIGDRDRILGEAREQADAVIATGRAERDHLVSENEITMVALAQREEILAGAREAAEKKRAQADAYADGKLAEFEAVLAKTLQTVERGRRRLADRAALPDEGEG